MATLFLLEDEIELREELAAFFVAQGHHVVESGSMAEFRRCYKETEGNLEIALIDRGLPDGDDLDLVAELRNEHSLNIGVIIFTARNESGEIVKGLIGGVDHYVCKPARLPELNAVVTALARRLPQKAEWKLSLVTHELLPPQMPGVQLTSLEMVFIKTVADAKGAPVSRKHIVTAFGEDYLQYDQNRLDTLVRRLRQKFEHEAGVVLPLHTVRSVGFLFSAPIVQLP